MSTSRDPALQALLVRPFRSLRLVWNDALAALSIRLRVQPIQCYSLAAMTELRNVLDHLSANRGVVRNLIVASDVPGVFNFGGDLALFVLLVRARDVDSLKMYGRRCVELVWWLETADDHGVMTFALVQGDSLGGGLESLLPMHRVICEQSVTAGFPEVLFNLFPGMGAWSFVSRKAGIAVANDMILSGRLYTAAELHARGLVDVVVDDNQGDSALELMLRGIEPRWRGTLAGLRARRVATPITLESLLTIVDQWAEAAMSLTDRDLRLMERLARAQIRKVGGSDNGAVEEIKRMELEEAWQLEQRAMPASGPLTKVADACPDSA